LKKITGFIKEGRKLNGKNKGKEKGKEIYKGKRIGYRTNKEWSL
jgi:hypothetical protein